MQLINFILKRKFNRFILSTTRIYQSTTLIILSSLFVVIIFFAIHDVQIIKKLRMDFQIHVSSFVTKTQPLTDVSEFDYNKE